MKFCFVENSKGEASSSLTMAVITFFIVNLWLLLWLIGTPFGLKVPTFNAADASLFLSPILALYFTRRYTDANSTGAVKSGNTEQ